MSKILKQAISRKNLMIFRDEVNPIRIQHNPEEYGLISLNNGNTITAACLRCHNPKCIFLQEFELENSNFSDFPYDKNPFVCPTTAITWNKNNDCPEIDKKSCISCGICAVRCPIGAIRICPNGAEINYQNSPILQEENYNDKTIKMQEECITKVTGIERIGTLILESDSLITHLYSMINEMNKEAQFPNILIRNLLIALGLRCSIRRRGDIYIRMDAIIESYDGKYGVAEIEFGKEALEIPRTLLDDIAVIYSRYKKPKEEIITFSFTYSLPNIRTEYWRVIKDIKQIFGIKINTLTVGALIVLLWNFVKFKELNEMFYIDIDNTSIRQPIESILNRRLNITPGFLGVFETSK